MNLKVINALSYFSIFFAPVIVPIIIWIVGDDADIIGNAKKAFWLQIIPFIFVVLAFILVGVTGLMSKNDVAMGWMTVILFGIGGLVVLITYIYDLVLGVKTLLA